MSRILVTRQLPQPAIDKLKVQFDEVEVFAEDRDMTKQEIINSMRGCEVLLSMLTNPVDKELMESNPNLKGVCNYAAGYNNIDTTYARQAGIKVCNTPDVLTESTADLTWALMLAAGRRVAEGDRLMRKKGFPGWEPMTLLGMDIYGKTLGIVGLGRIGLAVATRACGFGMKVLYYKASGPAVVLSIKAEFVPKDRLFREADFISIHTPLAPGTRHLIGEKELKLMKPTAVLVNTSRGAVIDEEALVKALKNGTIFAAGLDVYENEPALAEGLSKLPNAVLLPHIGSASIETRTAMALLAADNAIAVLKGKTPPKEVII
jgi:glyoxylate reductase